MINITEKQAASIVGLYKEGMSYDQIVEATGLSYYYVKQFIKENREKYGLERRKSFYSVARPLNSVAESTTGWNSALCKQFLTKQWGTQGEM